jgi:hypothetical protein
MQYVVSPMLASTWYDARVGSGIRTEVLLKPLFFQHFLFTTTLIILVEFKLW